MKTSEKRPALSCGSAAEHFGRVGFPEGQVEVYVKFIVIEGVNLGEPLPMVDPQLHVAAFYVHLYKPFNLRQLGRPLYKGDILFGRVYQGGIH